MTSVNAPFEDLFFEEFLDQRWDVSGGFRTITWNAPANLLYFPMLGTVPVESFEASDVSLLSAAFDLWDDALDTIRFQRVDDAVDADISIGTISIDGPGGILGIWDAETDGKTVTSAAILMDTSTTEAFATVALHEIGNVLGLGDIASSGDIRSVMEDPLSEIHSGGSLWEDDVALIRRYYGEGDPADGSGDGGPTTDPDQGDTGGGGGPGGLPTRDPIPDDPVPSDGPTGGPWPDDWIVGGSGSDYLIGTAGDDTFGASIGSDTIVGGLGDDVLVVDGDIDAYALNINDQGQNGDEVRLSFDNGVTFDTMVLGGVEQIAFTEGNAIFGDGVIDVDAFTGIALLNDSAIYSLIEMYIAYFDRAPDAVGLSYWGTRLADGMTMGEIAESFFVQPETQALYPEDMENAALVRTAYQNFLERDPDQEGWDYWTAELDSGLSRGTFMLSLINGAYGSDDPEAQTDVATIQAKADIGLVFGAVYGLSNTDAARAVMETYERGDEDTFFAAMSRAEDAAELASVPGPDAEFLMPMGWILEDRSFLDWI